VDKSSDWNTDPVWIRFNVEVDLLEPDYNDNTTAKIFDAMPYDNPNLFAVPFTGTSIDLWLPFMENDSSTPYNYLKKLINNGLVDPNINHIHIRSIRFDNYYDIYVGGYSPGTVNASNPPAFPILVNRG